MGGSGAATIDPTVVYAKVPFRLRLEHPLSPAFAVDTVPRASAVKAAIAKELGWNFVFRASLRQNLIPYGTPGHSVQIITKRHETDR